MPRHSVRKSISRPFLPIKHALVKSRTERGISSDSPSIQLARALLESALKDVDSVPLASPTTSSSSSTSHHAPFDIIDSEEDNHNENRQGLDNEIFNNGHGQQQMAFSNTKEKEAKGRRNSKHSRKTKSLDLSSSISRPMTLQRASSISSSSSSSGFSSRDGINQNNKACHASSYDFLGSHKAEGGSNGRTPQEILFRPRSKSISVLSHHTPPPCILLSTIAESSEEQNTSIQATDSTSSSVPSGADFPARSGLTENCIGKPVSNPIGRTIARSRASSLAVIPESRRERIIQDKHNQSETLEHIPACLATASYKLKHQSDHHHHHPHHHKKDNKSNSAEKEEDDDDWEVLSVRKRRKSCKYQIIPSSGFITSLIGSPSTSHTSSPIFSASSTLPSSEIKSKITDRHEKEINNQAQPRRRTPSFRSITVHFPRPLPRYRRASANDAIIASQHNTLDSSRISSAYKEYEQLSQMLSDAIKPSPSSSLDVWSEHLRSLLEESRLQNHNGETSLTEAFSIDDSGFASLHEESSVVSPSKAFTTTPAHSMISERKGDLPRIPTLALISPMGTLRRHTSCPDGILSSSPTKKIHRPLPPLPEGEHQCDVNIRGEDVNYSPILPPLPPYNYNAAEIVSFEPQETKENASKRKSIRRMSVINDLRRQILDQQQEEEISTLAIEISNSNQARRSNTIDTIQSSNIDSFKTAKSHTSSISSSVKLWPPPEELFASLFKQNCPTTASSSTPIASSYFTTKPSKRVAFSPSTKASAISKDSSENSHKSLTEFSTSTTTMSYTYDPNTPNDRKALQLVPRDLNTDLEVKPWWVVLPRFVLDDLAVGVRDWDKDKLEVHLSVHGKSRQKSV